MDEGEWVLWNEYFSTIVCKILLEKLKNQAKLDKTREL